MHIVHTIASIADPNAGPSYSATHLCAELAALGHTVDIHSVMGWREASSTPLSQPVSGIQTLAHKQDFAKIPVLRNLCMSQAMRRAINSSAVSPAVFHTHGLWLMPNIYPAQAARRLNVPFVISVRGMLGDEALQFSKAKKSLIWLALQKQAFIHASCTHATSEAEYGDIRKSGYRGPIAVIPNGVPLPPLDSPATESNRTRTVLSLGRLHPKKGLPQLLDAWAQLGGARSGWQLLIAGPDEGHHLQALQNQTQQLGLTDVQFLGALDQAQKWQAMQSADLFVLPSLNENFALTAAEALASATPIIASTGTPWAGVTDHKCGWWADPRSPALAAALQQAIGLTDDQRTQMGRNGRAWMATSFSWPALATSMAAVYDWLIHGGVRPAVVHVD